MKKDSILVYALVITSIFVTIVFCKLYERDLQKEREGQTLLLKSQLRLCNEEIESTKRQLSIFRQLKYNMFSDTFTLDYSQDRQIIHGKDENIRYQLFREGNFFVIQTYIVYDKFSLR